MGEKLYIERYCFGHVRLMDFENRQVFGFEHVGLIDDIEMVKEDIIGISTNLDLKEFEKDWMEFYQANGKRYFKRTYGASIHYELNEDGSTCREKTKEFQLCIGYQNEYYEEWKEDYREKLKELALYINKS